MPATVMEEDGFTLVRRGAKLRARGTPSAIALARAVALVETPADALSAADVARHVDAIGQCVAEVEASAVWAELRSALDGLEIQPGRLVCYGLGSPSLSHIARYQLGMLVLLARRVASLRAAAADASASGREALAASVYDPILSAGDREILTRLGLHVPRAQADVSHAVDAAGDDGDSDDGGRGGDDSEREPGPSAGARGRLAAHTLFFMPHCDATLYDAVLAANWPDSLARVVVLGNSFRGYAERVVDRRRLAPTPRLDEVAAWTCERPIADTFKVGGVFNNLSLHTFAEPDGGAADVDAKAAPAAAESFGGETLARSDRPARLASGQSGECAQHASATGRRG
jgi:hypothetical protein